MGSPRRAQQSCTLNRSQEAFRLSPVARIALRLRPHSSVCPCALSSVPVSMSPWGHSICTPSHGSPANRGAKPSAFSDLWAPSLEKYRTSIVRVASVAFAATTPKRASTVSPQRLIWSGLGASGAVSVTASKRDSSLRQSAASVSGSKIAKHWTVSLHVISMPGKTISLRSGPSRSAAAMTYGRRATS